MPGRATQVDQETAISRIEELAPYADSLRNHVHEIVTSRAFKGSRRSCEFLTYVVEKALAGHFDQLKERTLGVELFGRDPSYDTSGDAIVRVTASDVRKRLLQFYGSINTQPDVRIDLPLGSYIVEFRQMTDTRSVEDLEPELSVESLVPATRSQFVWRMALVIFAAAVVMVSIGLSIYYWQTRFAVTDCVPWSTMLQKNRQLKIVFSDPDIATLQGILGFRILLSDYAGHQYIPQGHSFPPEAARIAHVFRGMNVPAVDANIALRINDLIRPFRMQTYRARSLQSLDFKTEDNFIVLGSPLSNPWISLFQDQLDFDFKYDEERREEVIRNKRPAHGEAAVYVPTVPGWGTGQAFAIVGFLANPNQSGHVMILAGSNAVATEAAGKLITNAELVAQALRERGFDPHDERLQFEMLLRVSTIAASLNTFDIVACHHLSPRLDEREAQTEPRTK